MLFRDCQLGILGKSCIHSKLLAAKFSAIILLLFKKTIAFFQINNGIQVTLTKMPHHFAAIDSGIYNSLSDWKPFETYLIIPAGGMVFPSYDTGTKKIFEKNTFLKTRTVSIRVSLYIWAH